MKKLLLAVLVAALASGCGYKSRDNELSGQPKRVLNVTPMMCPDYTAVDISMGIVRNGVGSMSGHDMMLAVDEKGNADTLRQAASNGLLVKLTYNTKRFSICTPQMHVTKVEIVK